MIAKELVSNSVMPLVLKDTFQQGLSIMAFYHLRHLPVVDKKRIIGVVSEEDLLNFKQNDPISSLLETDAIKKVVTLADKHIYEVMQLMGEHKLTMIPVIDDQETYIGIITQDEILKHFTEFSSIAEPGSILVISTKKRDYSLSEIARIVESENGTVLSSHINYIPDTDLLEVTLKINKQEINPIIATFERYNYNIKAAYNENDYHHMLNDRFEHLMSYLNV